MYYIIVNPASKSGRGAKIFVRIEPVLKEKAVSYEVFFSERAGHVITITKELCSRVPCSSEDPLKLIVLGGDGTLNETLQGISDFSCVAIGYIPTGSSNDMARDLHLPKDPVEILTNILSCKKPLCMDMGQVVYENTTSQLSRHHSNELLTVRRFAVSCGIGFDAAVCEEALASRFKNILNKIGLGKLTYLTIALKQLIAARKVSCDMYLDDSDTPIHLNRFLFVAGMVHQYEGGGFKFCPGADHHDGVLDICVAGDIPKPKILIVLPTAFQGKHYRFRGVDKYTARKLRLVTSAPLWVHTDGEVSMKSSSITLTCGQNKLQMLL